MGSAFVTISPGFPAYVGVEIPTVKLRETVASPWMNNEFASTPLDEVDVILLLKILIERKVTFLISDSL